MIARLNTNDGSLASPQLANRQSFDLDTRSNPVMGRVTADYDDGILTLRGTVDSLDERQFAEDAYTALGVRSVVRNLIRIATPARAK